MSESQDRTSIEFQRQMTWKLGSAQSSVFDAIRLVPEDKELLAMHQALRRKMEHYAPDIVEPIMDDIEGSAV